MNPKTPQDLDPKLKEAYDRVMGGNFSPAAPAPKIPEIPKMETPTPAATNPAIPPATPLANPMGPTPVEMPPINVVAPQAASAGQQVFSTKKKSKISPMIFLILGLSFFAVYAVVWAKLFKLF